MKGEDITLEDIERLHLKFRDFLYNMFELQQWMERKEFPRNDRIYSKLYVATHTMRDLVTELHLRSTNNFWIAKHPRKINPNADRGVGIRRSPHPPEGYA